jgi:Tfp pilus assembly protein PilF
MCPPSPAAPNVLKFGPTAKMDWGSLRSTPERALGLRPNLAAAHALRGNIAVHRGDWVAAELHYARAISLDASDAMLLATHATFVLESVGHIEHALRKLHDASVLVPADPRMMLTLAVGHSIAGEDVQALEYAQLAVKFGFGENVPPLPMVLALAAVRADRHADAAEHIVRMLPAVPGAADTARLSTAHLRIRPGGTPLRLRCRDC